MRAALAGAEAVQRMLPRAAECSGQALLRAKRVRYAALLCQLADQAVLLSC
jgi:hypothetical protein